MLLVGNIISVIAFFQTLAHLLQFKYIIFGLFLITHNYVAVGLLSALLSQFAVAVFLE